jgi:FkbM family methyltransferase
MRFNDIIFYATNISDLEELDPNYERRSFNEVIRVLSTKEGAVFIDVGAHIGRYSFVLAKLFPNAKVIAIEPNPEAYQALIKGIKANGLRNVTALNIALSDFDGVAHLYIKRGTAISSLVEGDNSFKIIDVPAKRLDTVMEELGINKVDIIKIDVEGAEFHVIKGAVNTIKKYKPVLIIEIRERNLYDVISLLGTLGYNCVKIEGENYLCKTS